MINIDPTYAKYGLAIIIFIMMAPKIFKAIKNMDKNLEDYE